MDDKPFYEQIRAWTDEQLTIRKEELRFLLDEKVPAIEWQTLHLKYDDVSVLDVSVLDTMYSADWLDLFWEYHDVEEEEQDRRTQYYLATDPEALEITRQLEALVNPPSKSTTSQHEEAR